MREMAFRQGCAGRGTSTCNTSGACALLQAPGLLPPPGSFFPQSATDIAQIQELQTQVEDAKKEKQSLREKVIPPQTSCTELSSEIPAPSEPHGTRQWDAIPMATVRPSLHRGVTKQFLLHKTGRFLLLMPCVCPRELQGAGAAACLLQRWGWGTHMCWGCTALQGTAWGWRRFSPAWLLGWGPSAPPWGWGRSGLVAWGGMVGCCSASALRLPRCPGAHALIFTT